MKTMFKMQVLIIFLILITSCESKKDAAVQEDRKTVEMVTSFGTILFELYNETPLHRDNFIKLTNEGVFDSLLFHRVINEFMIQGGDPDSRLAKAGDTLGNGGLDYQVDAEINKNLFHKRGAVGAARDGNPDRASSAMQFYIVQRGVQSDSMLIKAETRINGWLADYYFKKDPKNKALIDTLQKTLDANDMQAYKVFNDSLRKLAGSYTSFERYKIPEQHKSVYKSLGGTPHLDQNYTVFGEVINGLDIVDSIAKVQTGLFDRPKKDIRILSARVLGKNSEH